MRQQFLDLRGRLRGQPAQHVLDVGIRIVPPGVTDCGRFLKVAEILRAAQRKAYDIIKAGPGDEPVGMTAAMHDFQPASPDAVSATTSARRMMEDLFLENCRGDDFIGVQTYTRLRIGADGKRVLPGPDVESTQMGWEF